MIDVRGGWLGRCRVVGWLGMNFEEVVKISIWIRP